MMVRNWMVIIVLLLPAIAGCAQSWRPARSHLPYVWKGKPAEHFFAKHGEPIATEHHGKGAATYIWQSRPNVRAIRMAQRSYLNAEDRPVHKCVLRIEADKHGEVIDMEIVEDGIGLWGTSSCNEMFAGDPRHERTAIINLHGLQL